MDPATAMAAAQGGRQLLLLGVKFFKAHQKLKAAMRAAEVTCQDILDTFIAAGPWVVKVASIGQLYGDDDPELMEGLDHALSACARAADEACMEVYKYLCQDSTAAEKLQKKLQATDVAMMLEKRCAYFRNRLEDVQWHINTAAYLNQLDVMAKLKAVQQDVAVIRELKEMQQGMRKPERALDIAHINALAKAHVQRREDGGQKLEGHSDEVYGVAWSPDGRTLASASDDKTVRLWREDTGQKLQALEGFSIGACSVTWSPNGDVLATGDRVGSVMLWRGSLGGRPQVLQGHSSVVRGLAWSPDGGDLATGSYDGTAALWSAETGEQLRVLKGHSDKVNAVAWSPDGCTVATASFDRTAVLWCAGSGEQLRVLKGHSDWVQDVAWSPDGGTLATGSVDGTAALWSAETGEQLRLLKGHTSWVNSVAWSPDGEVVATGSSDNTAALWRAKTGERLRVLKGHSRDIMRLAWAPNGQTIATGAVDHTVRLYHIAAEKFVKV